MPRLNRAEPKKRERGTTEQRVSEKKNPFSLLSRQVGVCHAMSPSVLFYLTEFVLRCPSTVAGPTGRCRRGYANVVNTRILDATTASRTLQLKKNTFFVFVFDWRMGFRKAFFWGGERGQKREIARSSTVSLYIDHNKKESYVGTPHATGFTRLHQMGCFLQRSTTNCTRESIQVV